jgi:hypothetical protein
MGNLIVIEKYFQRNPWNFNKDSTRKKKRQDRKKENGMCSDKTTNLLLRK